MEDAYLKRRRSHYMNRATVLLRGMLVEENLEGQVLPSIIPKPSETPASSASPSSISRRLRILLLLRSIRRRFVNEEDMIEVLRNESETFNYEFKVVRFENASMADQPKTISWSDVFIGMSGAGLTWTFAQRPRTTVLEINYAKHSNAPNNGIDRNLFSYFGTTAAMAGAHHAVLQVADSDVVAGRGGESDVRCPIDRYTIAVRCTICFTYFELLPLVNGSTAPARTRSDCCPQGW
jgi:hypothetical protein